MMSDTERKILEFMSKNLLTTTHELSAYLKRERHNGTDIAIQRLKDSGLIEKVESLGTCFVITQKGMKHLRGD
jgi:hypothetical protein